MLNDDIKLAQKIVSGSYNNTGSLFYHDKSFIYKFSNEEISSYQKYQKNKKKMLSITASGDQILNSILAGSINIKSCDISRFPKYFFELKRAAILNLTKDEFINFFINESDYDQILNDDIYDGFRNDLDQDDRKFWDSLFQFFEGGQIYDSFLFSHEIVTLSSAIERNVYLQDSNYNKLQNVITKANVSHYVGDIKDIIQSDHDSYDLVNLSSIIYYGFNGFDDYKNLIENINLNEDGVTLTYLYQLRNRIKQVFTGDSYTFDMFKSGEGVMVYKKKK
jgi:hypothetical protein